MSAIIIESLTKDFGQGRGIFDVSLQIEQGEVFGFLGPNGAGKTTTIRHLLGFLKPQRGSATIHGLDTWANPKEVQNHLGYLPGEIAFPNDMKGKQFIEYIAQMRKLNDLTKAKRLIEMFEFDPNADLKRMSKGMKQKVGIICAFMHDPEVLILDEPTSGLDPLMQARFVDLIRDEKKAGKSILMSSHLFEEVESTSDRIGMIKGGKLISIINMKDIGHAQSKTYKIEFLNADDFVSMQSEAFDIKESKPENNQLIIDIRDENINELLRVLSMRKVKFISEVKHTLEEHFMGYYEGGNNHVQ